jgi:hypothetical protein
VAGVAVGAMAADVAPPPHCTADWGSGAAPVATGSGGGSGGGGAYSSRLPVEGARGAKGYYEVG